MTEKIYTLCEIQTLLSPIFKNHNVKKAIVFGSYGKNCAVAESDVDIFVDSKLHGLAFIALVEDIRDALEKDVDVIDIRHVDDGTPIALEIQNYGTIIYEE